MTWSTTSRVDHRPRPPHAFIYIWTNQFIFSHLNILLHECYKSQTFLKILHVCVKHVYVYVGLIFDADTSWTYIQRWSIAYTIKIYSFLMFVVFADIYFKIINILTFVKCIWIFLNNIDELCVVRNFFFENIWIISENIINF